MPCFGYHSRKDAKLSKKTDISYLHHETGSMFSKLFFFNISGTLLCFDFAGTTGGGAVRFFNKC